jgi:hypothetical protein
VVQPSLRERNVRCAARQANIAAWRMEMAIPIAVRGSRGLYGRECVR